MNRSDVRGVSVTGISKFRPDGNQTCYIPLKAEFYVDFENRSYLYCILVKNAHSAKKNIKNRTFLSSVHF